MTNQTQISLDTLEAALIARMAKESGVHDFQMISMIKRNSELKAFYKDLREKCIVDLAR